MYRKTTKLPAIPALFLIAALSALTVLLMSAGCGSDSGGGDGGSVPAEEAGDPRIRSADGTYSIDDLKTAGVKANKEYDVEDLPGADAAWRIIFNRLDYEVPLLSRPPNIAGRRHPLC